jgi:hypothetical protein
VWWLVYLHPFEQKCPRPTLLMTDGFASNKVPQFLHVQRTLLFMNNPQQVEEQNALRAHCLLL